MLQVKVTDNGAVDENDDWKVIVNSNKYKDHQNGGRVESPMLLKESNT